MAEDIYYVIIIKAKNILLYSEGFSFLGFAFLLQGSLSTCQLSEPLLWFILRVLDTSEALKAFHDMGRPSHRQAGLHTGRQALPLLVTASDVQSVSRLWLVAVVLTQ